MLHLIAHLRLHFREHLKLHEKLMFHWSVDLGVYLRGH